MAVTFEFIQDFREYRKYITYITKVEEAIGKLPLLFYQGDMLDCFIVEKKGNIVTVLLTNSTDDLIARFTEEAQPDSFESIPENIAYLYDLDRHTLIYNYDAKEVSADWNWSTYPDTLWMAANEKYDHGLVLAADGSLCRLYLSNTRLMSLFIGLQEVESSFPDLLGKVTPQFRGVHTALAILARQLGQSEPKPVDVKKAISCDMVKTTKDEYPKYDFKEVIELFDEKGNEDDLWEDTWKTSLDKAIARDDDLHRTNGETTLGTLLSTGNLTSRIDDFGFKLNMSDLSSMSEVPETDRPLYVHMDIPINGIHYILVEPDQTLAIFFDDQIIRGEDILQLVENLPQDQISLNGDYANIEDDISAMDKSGTISTADDSGFPYTDQELGLDGDRYS